MGRGDAVDVLREKFELAVLGQIPDNKEVLKKRKLVKRPRWVSKSRKV